MARSKSTDTTWFSGGVSKIQMGFTLAWSDPAEGSETGKTGDPHGSERRLQHHEPQA